MWTFIFILAFFAAALAFAYICRRVYIYIPSCNIPSTRKNKAVRVLLCIYSVIAVVTLFALIFGYINALVIIVHLVVIGLLCDLVFLIVRKIRGKKFKIDFAAVCALVITFAYLTIGYILANCVWVTSYSIMTDKNVGELRIVLFADSHIGATFDGEGLNAHVRKMQDYNPDIVIVAGDFVDDGTDRENMLAACRALGKIDTTYGIFFAFGNHDKGYYDNSLRGFTGDELVAELKSIGVTVLEDEITLVDDRFYIVGRRDAEDERVGINELMSGLDNNKFSIIIDHQPNDYANEQTANADLVLSGHTHGGQMWPLGLMMNIFNLNDRVYGYEKRGNTNFIVTSGISDWEIKFKTGTKSEFVVIDVCSAV